MKLKDFLENINQMIQENPDLLEFEVVYAKDDEGNEFDNITYEPSLGYFDVADWNFIHKDNFEEMQDDGWDDLEVNSICIN